MQGLPAAATVRAWEACNGRHPLDALPDGVLPALASARGEVDSAAETRFVLSLLN